MDALDGCALHAVVFGEGGEPLATGRLLPPEDDPQRGGTLSRIGRMAVRGPFRGHGLGWRILDALIDAARARGDARIELHAQCHAGDFYERRGFLPHGQVFEEAGIPHRTMVLELRPAA
ncbi:MAG: GNAT family N-acetyltransferase [Xylophilus ampelinus]